MSPSGISFFYGGLNPDVCVHEVGPGVAEMVNVAEFEVTRQLIVLNLTMEVESRRSIFDTEYSFSYDEYFKPFLEHFINDIEYVPTQVFTEFIKTKNFSSHYYRPDSSGNESDVFIDGVLFKSSAMKDGVNLVLFKGPDISTTAKESPGDAWLLYKGKRIHQVTEISVKSEYVKIPTIGSI
ncbi:MAG: hypothetical protein ACI8PB_005417 [Desulforhopalus sp.]|jgi:hypothetical protein